MSAIAAAVGFDGLGSWFDHHRRLTTALRWLGWATAGVLVYAVLILLYGCRRWQSAACSAAASGQESPASSRRAAG